VLFIKWQRIQGGFMKQIFLLVLIAWINIAYAHADVLIEIDRGRTQGFFTKKPVFQRAILVQPDKPTDIAVLHFRGYPGIARIETVWDKRIEPFMRTGQQIFTDEGIALVIMDCPTDQWGAPGPNPSACYDSYRSSKEHADDVRSVMAKLRSEYGISKFFVMGHSMGTISSRWLAKNLGNEIAGSIHSSAMNVAFNGIAGSVWHFPYDTIKTPILHVHNEKDACNGTPYSIVKAYAGENLMTVKGGVAQGDPCGGGHLHSHQGREELVVRSIISWIKTNKFERVIGE